MTTSSSTIFFACVLLIASCGQPPAAMSEEFVQFKLPKALTEISGLTTVQGNRVLAVADEEASIFEIDAAAGEVIRRFEVGQPTLRGDFEGIALAGERLFLITSTGELVESTLQGNVVQRSQTGLADRCEVEGLAAHPSGSELWIACKTPLSSSLKGTTAIFSWTLERQALALVHRLPYSVISESTGKKRFSSSAIMMLSAERALLIAAKEKSWMIVGPDGLEQAGRLPNRQAHPQAEAITALDDGTIVLGDEGGNKRARLSRYANFPS